MKAEELLQRYIDGETDFSGLDLAGINLDGNFLQGKSLTGINFSGANLYRAYLWCVYLDKANLTQANLSHSYLGEGIYSESDFTDANLQFSLIYSAEFNNTILHRTNFNHCRDLSEVNFSDADLTEALLTNITAIAYCDFSNAKLNNTDFTGSDG